MNRSEIEAQLVTQAGADAAFRARLIADPRAAIAETCGIEIPETITIQVVEETSDRLCLVLPPASELSDADLAGVSGGAHADGTLFGK